MPTPSGSGKGSQSGPARPITPGNGRNQEPANLPTQNKSFAAATKTGLSTAQSTVKQGGPTQKLDVSSHDGNLSARTKSSEASQSRNGALSQKKIDFAIAVSIGLESQIATTNGSQIQGFLHSYNSAGDIVMQEAIPVQGAAQSSREAYLVVEKKDVVALTVPNVNLRPPSFRSPADTVAPRGPVERISTDAELAARQGRRPSEQRAAELVPFDFESADHHGDGGLQASTKEIRHWDADSMFKHNDENHKKSDFRDDLSQYTIKLEKKDTPEYHEMVRKAERTASEIQMLNSKGGRYHRKGSDSDEGQEDEEGKYSAVTGPSDNRYAVKKALSGNWRNSEARPEPSNYSGNDSHRFSGPQHQNSPPYQQQRNSHRGGSGSVSGPPSSSQDVRGSSSRESPIGSQGEWQVQGGKQRGSVDRPSPPVSVTPTPPPVSSGAAVSQNRPSPQHASPPNASGKPPVVAQTSSAAATHVPPPNVQSFKQGDRKPVFSGPSAPRSGLPAGGDLARGGAAKPPFSKQVDKQQSYPELTRSPSGRSSERTGKENQSGGSGGGPNSLGRPSPDIDGSTPVQPYFSPPARSDSASSKPLENAWSKKPNIGVDGPPPAKYDSPNHPPIQSVTFTNQNHHQNRAHYQGQDGNQRQSRQNSSEFVRHSHPGAGNHHQQQRDSPRFQNPRYDGGSTTFRDNRSKEASPVGDASGRSTRASPRPASVDDSTGLAEDRTDHESKAAKWNINAKEFVPTQPVVSRVSPHRDDGSSHSHNSASPVADAEPYRGPNIQRQHSGGPQNQYNQQHHHQQQQQFQQQHHHQQQQQQQQHHQQQQQQHHLQQQQQHQNQAVSPSAGYQLRPDFYPQGFMPMPMTAGFPNPYAVQMYNQQQQQQQPQPPAQQPFPTVILPARPAVAQVPSFPQSPQPMFMVPTPGGPPPQMIYAQGPPGYMPNGMQPQQGDPAMYAQMQNFMMAPQMMGQSPNGQILWGAPAPGAPFQPLASQPGLLYAPGGQYPPQMGQHMAPMMPYMVQQPQHQQQQQNGNPQAGFMQAPHAQQQQHQHYRPPGGS